jgi:two-component system, response regulator
MANEPTIMNDFGATVKARRTRLRLTQEELAERAGLHRTYITDVERGRRNISLHSIERLARALEVPIAGLLGDVERARESAGRGRSPETGPVDILLVEDNPKDEELALRALRRARLVNTIHVARDGAEAVDYLFCAGRYTQRRMEDHPQLVLLDLKLPRIDGLEVLRRIKADKRTRSLPVVILTVSESGEDVVRARQLGAEAYIIKPVSFERLCRVTPDLRLSWTLQGMPNVTAPLVEAKCPPLVAPT